MGSVSRVHTFASAAVLTAAQLNNEFDNLLTSSAINGGLDATNLGVTAGQITASKAVVVDGSRNLDDGTTSNQINNLVLSGTLSVAGATTQTGALSIDDNTDSTSTTTGSIHTDGGVGIALDLIVGNDVKLLTDSSVLSLGIGSDATLTHDGTTGLTIAANPVIVDSGDALTLDAHTGIHIFKDAGTEVLRFTEGNSGDVTIKLATNGKDLIFTDHGDATGLKVLDAAAGINVPGEVQTTKIAYTDGDDALTIADGGGVTTSGTFESGGAATLASLVCTAAGTFGGGYGATGATISTAGVIQANGAITSDGAVTGATLAGTVSTAAQNSITSASSLATVGTIGTGVWQGTAVASAYLDADTAHLSTTQTFSGAKTFSAAAQFSNTVTVGVNGTGYDVQLFGDTSGSNILWDQSADDLIFTNAGIAVGSDATGDIYYRDASGFLARLGASTDGHVLTTGGAGTIPAWEALPSGGTFSGPGSSTENAIVRFTNTSGNSGDNSGILIDDSNNVTGAGNVTLSGELDAATGDFSGIIDVAGAATLASLVCTAGGTFGGGYGSTGATISTAGVGQFNGALTTDGVFTAASLDISGDADIDGTLETDALTIGGTALLANDTNNRVTTATGSGTFNGEANLTFDGTTLALADGRTLLVGGTSAVTTSVTATAQILGTTSADTSLMIGRWSADNDHAHIYFAKSRNATPGSSTIVQDDDHLGAVHFMADDGTDFNSEAASIRARIDGAPGSNDVPGRLIFSTTADGAASPTERMTIDSTGMLRVIGTAASATSADGAAGVAYFTGAASDSGIALGSFTTSPWRNWVQSQQENGTVADLILQTRGANVGIGTNGPGYKFEVLTDSNGGWTSRMQNEGNSSPYVLWLRMSGASTTTTKFLQCTDNAAGDGNMKFIVYGDGDVVSATNSYTSDAKLKQDIVDVRSYWDDFKSVRFRKFRFKSDVALDENAPLKFGVVAQEIEQLFPTLVNTRSDTENRQVAVLDDDGNPTYEQTQKLTDDGDAVLDDDGNAVMVDDTEKPVTEEKVVDLGTTTKSVKYSVLNSIGLKVVQELQTRLEAAEAKIAALESA